MLRSRTVKIIAAIAAIAAIIGYALWRQTATRDEENKTRAAQAAQAQAVKQREQAVKQQDTPNTAQAEQLKTLAIKFEHATRDWGVDPAVAQNKQLIGANTQAIIPALRTPEKIEFPNINQLTTLKPADGGAHSHSAWFNAPDKSKPNLYEDIYDYWRNQSYSAGNRINPNTFQVKILDPHHVRISFTTNPLWTDGYTHTATPVEPVKGFKQTWFWQTVKGSIPVTDTLTIQNGKVVQRETLADKNLWIIDPYLSNWAADRLPVANMSFSEIAARQDINPAVQIGSNMWGKNPMDAQKGDSLLTFTFYPIHGAFPIDQLMLKNDDLDLTQLKLGKRGIWDVPVSAYSGFPEIMETIQKFGEL